MSGNNKINLLCKKKWWRRFATKSYRHSKKPLIYQIICIKIIFQAKVMILHLCPKWSENLIT